jgi:hypothetical protein
MRKKEKSNLEIYTEKELERTRLTNKEKKCVLKMVKLWSSFDYNEISLKKCLAIFNLAVNFKALTPLTDDPNEWERVNAYMWQSRRIYSAFSKDGGKTYYDIDTKKVPFWKFWIKKNRENGQQIFKTLKTGGVRGN